ncbi:MAG: hypothetical protein ACKPFF_18400 [Planktothrix sp.]
MPVPSKLIVTLTSVSPVFRCTVAIRGRISKLELELLIEGRSLICIIIKVRNYRIYFKV